jgi:hypothetical protein
MQYLTLKEVVKKIPHLNKLILKCPDGSIGTFQPLHKLPDFVYRIPYVRIIDDYDALICYVAPLRVVDIIQICPYPGLPFEVSDGVKTWDPSADDMTKLVAGVKKMHNTIVLFLKGV